jgi:acyl dehydratase
MDESRPRLADLRVGDRLPALAIPVTPTSVMATALATRDYAPVHHDADRARELGSRTVFTSTHAVAGYLERLVLQWAGPRAFLRSLKLRLGVPNYAGDTLTLTGEVTAIDVARGEVAIAAKGTNAQGEHVTAQLVVALQEAGR